MSKDCLTYLILGFPHGANSICLKSVEGTANKKKKKEKKRKVVGRLLSWKVKMSHSHDQSSNVASPCFKKEEAVDETERKDEEDNFPKIAMRRWVKWIFSFNLWCKFADSLTSVGYIFFSSRFSALFS